MGFGMVLTFDVGGGGRKYQDRGIGSSFPESKSLSLPLSSPSSIFAVATMSNGLASTTSWEKASRVLD